MSNATIHIPSSPEFYDAALEGLVRLDEHIIRAGAAPLSVYDSGAVYKKEPLDTFRHALDVTESGWGDCEDLAAYLAAGYRVSGQDPGAHVFTYATGPHRFHAVVKRSNGLIEDPSRQLGMRPLSAGGNETVSASDVDEAPHALRKIREGRNMHGPNAIIGEDPTPEYKAITWDIIPANGGWTGVIRIPGRDGQALFMKTSTAKTPGHAAVKTVNMTKLAAKNPMVQAAMPPQAQLAAKILTKAPTGKAAGLLAKRARF